MTGLADIRDTLAYALEEYASTYMVSPYPPPVVIPPAIIIVPDAPYLEPATIGPRTQLRVRYRLTCCVAMLDDQAALQNLEELLLNVFAAVPPGWQVGVASAPSVETVGPSDLLTADVAVEAIIDVTS
jgi:hypothetical protein